MSLKQLLAVLLFLCFNLNATAFTQHPQLSIADSKEYKEVMNLMSKKEFADAEIIFDKLINSAQEQNNIPDAIILLNLKAKTIMHQWRTDEALSIYQDVYDQAKIHHMDSLHADAITALTVMYTFLDKKERNLPLIKEGLALKNIGSKEKSDLLSFYGLIHLEQNKYDSAVYFLNLAIDIDLAKKDSSSLANNNNTLGNIYHAQENKTDLSLKHYFKSLSYLRKNQEYHKIKIYSNIAKTMLQIRNIPKAKYYAKQALGIANTSDLKSYTANSNTIKAQIEEIDENYNEALEHLRISNEANLKPNKIQTKIDNAIVKISCLLKLDLPIDPSELDELIEYNGSSKKSYTSLRIGYVALHYATKKNLDTDLFYQEFNKLKTIAEKKKEPYVLKDLYQLEYKYLVEKKDFKNANQAILNYHSQVNEIFKERQQFVTLDLEAKYSKEKQDQQITVLEKDNILQEVKLKQQRIYLIGGAIGLMIISILSFFIYRLYIKLAGQNSKISRALKEKDFLLREIHHRVKNNLQVISSLLSLQSRQIKDEEIKRAINEGRSRVRSMALIHQNLYQNENLTGVNVAHYMSKLVHELFDTYKIDQNKIALNLDIQEMELDVDTMVPLGLILNELVSNCLKHAFPDNRSGSIFVSLEHKSDNLHLKVKDNGIGTTLVELEESNSFGNRLIKAFSQKLKAELEVIDADGTEVIMLIKKFKKVA